jgi:hypothetical protein
MLNAPDLSDLRLANPVSVDDARELLDALDLRGRIASHPDFGPEPLAVAPKRRRRFVVRAAIVVAAAVAAVIAVLAAPQSHTGGVLDDGPRSAGAAILTRMEAAIGTGTIMHMVREGPAGTSYVDLKTGKRTPAVLTEELWTNRHGFRLHLVERVNGRVVGDLRSGDRGFGVYAGPQTPAFLALWTGYHAALQNKYAPAELGGRGRVDGHSVYWIRFPLWYNTGGPTRHGRPNPKSRPKPLAQTRVAVDTHTFEPILEQTYEGGGRFDTRILLARAITYRPSELYRSLGPKLFNGTSPGHPFGGHPFAGLTRQEKTKLGLGQNPHRLRKLSVVPAPWLTPGKSVAGLGFRHVSRLLAQPPDEVGGLPMVWRLVYRAARLVYRPALHGLREPFSTTTVDETFRPADPRPWAGLPRGSIEVQPGESVTKQGSHRLWTGYMLEHGVYITITTPAGEHALLQIARALHPVRK